MIDAFTVIQSCSSVLELFRVSVIIIVSSEAPRATKIQRRTRVARLLYELLNMGISFAWAEFHSSGFFLALKETQSGAPILQTFPTSLNQS